MRYSLIALLLATASAAHSQPASVAAIVHYQQQQLSSDGVQQQRSYRQQLIRIGDKLWSQRLIPAQAAHSTHPHAGHDHPDLQLAARFIWKTPTGTAAMLVDAEHQIKVPLTATEQAELGLSDWTQAYFLFDPKQLSQLERVGESDGIEHYRKQTAQGSLSLDWDSHRQIALRIEHKSPDGQQQRRMELEFQPLPQHYPWQQIEHYQAKDYSDWLD